MEIFFFYILYKIYYLNTYIKQNNIHRIRLYTSISYNTAFYKFITYLLLYILILYINVKIKFNSFYNYIVQQIKIT